VRELNEQLAST